MQITKREPVTRSYCDGCGNEMRNETVHGLSNGSHQSNYIEWCSTCDSTVSRVNWIKKDTARRNERIQRQPFY